MLVPGIQKNDFFNFLHFLTEKNSGNPGISSETTRESRVRKVVHDSVVSFGHCHNSFGAWFRGRRLNQRGWHVHARPWPHTHQNLPRETSQKWSKTLKTFENVQNVNFFRHYICGPLISCDMKALLPRPELPTVAENAFP